MKFQRMGKREHLKKHNNQNQKRMNKFTVTLKEAIKSWNERNPTLRKKTISSLAEEIGMTKQDLSQLGKRSNKKLNSHLEVIFANEDKAKINWNWEHYLTLNIIALNHFEAVRKALNCSIWDLIKKESN